MKRARCLSTRINDPRISVAHHLGYTFSAAAFVLGCSVQRSELVTTAPDNGTGGNGSAITELFADAATAAAIERVVNERPIGGASLGTGTNGGGSLAEAQGNGRVYWVDSEAALLSAVSGDTPAILLILEGVYDFTLVPGRASKACSVACTPNTPVATQTLASSSCETTATLFSTYSTYETARVGNNKTIIGLGKGATLRNLRLDLSGSSNVIVRNLALTDVNPGIFHDGEGIQLAPADHVWIDHCTFKNESYTSVRIVSSWSETNQQALTTLAGYVTLSWNHFDGRTSKACGGQDPTVLSANRVPGLTLHHNWFDTTDNWNPYLLGPGTWAHIFNNTWSNVTSVSVGVTCGATALLEGNSFDNARDSVYISDSGAPTWAFCQAGLFGRAFAPSALADDQQNLIDANSAMSLNGQPVDGSNIQLPSRLSGHAFQAQVPASALGDPAATYEYSLEAMPSGVSEKLKVTAGAGHLF